MSSFTTLRAHRPSYTPTKGHVWPVAFDPTSAFITSESKKSNDGNSTQMEVDTPAPAGGASDAPTPATARGGSVQPQNQPPIRSPGDTQLITMPLLHAIRTTATHTLSVSPLPFAVPGPGPSTSGKKRVVRNALELIAPAPIQAESGNANQQSAPGLSLTIPNGNFIPSLLGEPHLSASGARFDTTPGTPGGSTPNSFDPGTPAPGAPKKKKKR